MTCNIKSDAGAEYYLKLMDRSDPEYQRERSKARYLQKEVEAGREPPGRWYCSDDTLLDIFGIESGSVVLEEDFRRLHAGIDPTTNKPFILGDEKTVAAHDMVFGAPKSVSVLFGLSDDPKLRAAILSAHDRAVSAAVEHVIAPQGGRVRTGKQGRGEPLPVGLIAARFSQGDSRPTGETIPGDPHLHTHFVLLNAGLAEDGKWRRLDAAYLYDLQSEAGRIYEAELARILQDEHRLDITSRFEPSRRRAGFEINGVDKELCDFFSKRAQQIAERANGGDMRSRAHAQRNTRGAKHDNDIDRYDYWREAAHENFADVDIRWKRAFGRFDASRKLDEIEWDEFSKAVLENDSYVDGNVLRAAIYSRLIGYRMAPNDMMAKADEVIAEHFVDIGGHKNGRQTLYTSERTIAQEKRLREIAAAMGASNRHALAKRSIDALIAKSPHLSDEQRHMVRVALGTSQLSIVLGAAGSGKSTTLRVVAEGERKATPEERAAEEDERREKKHQFDRTVADSLRAAGATVIGMSTSWSATEELQKSIGGECRAIKDWTTRWAHEKNIPRGKPVVVVIDEGAMTSREDTLPVLEMAYKNDWKVIITGDTKQLKPVGAGNPIAIMSSQLPDHSKMRINTTVRQLDADDRAATTAISESRAEEAIAYARKNGRWHELESSGECVDRALDVWRSEKLRGVSDVAMIAPTNGVVNVLNRRIRQELIDAGIVAPNGIQIAAVDKSEQAFTLELSVGDEIRFAEKSKELKDLVRNGTRARVLSVDKHFLRFQVLDEKGRPGDAAKVPWSALKDDEGRVKLSFAYAMTTHAAQGISVKCAIGVFARGSADINQNLYYVIASRHRERFIAVVNVAAIRQEIARNERITDLSTITDEQIEAHLLKSMKREQEKPNALDQLRRIGIEIASLSDTKSIKSQIEALTVDAAKALNDRADQRQLAAVGERFGGLKAAAERMIEKAKIIGNAMRDFVDRRVAEKERKQRIPPMAEIRVPPISAEAFEKHRATMLKHLDEYVLLHDPREHQAARASYLEISGQPTFRSLPEREVADRLLRDGKTPFAKPNPPWFQDLDQAVRAAKLGRNERVDADVRDVFVRTLDALTYRPREPAEQAKLELNLRFDLLRLKSLGYDLRAELVAGRRPGLVSELEAIAKRQNINLTPARGDRSQQQDLGMTR